MVILGEFMKPERRAVLGFAEVGHALASNGFELNLNSGYFW